MGGQQNSPFGSRSILPLDPEASLPNSSVPQAGGGSSTLGVFLAPLDALLHGGHPVRVCGGATQAAHPAPPQPQVSAAHKVTHSKVS